MVLTKLCNGCRVPHAWDNYYPENRVKDGLQPRCKQCQDAKAYKHRTENKAQYNQKQKEKYARDPEKHKRGLWKCALKRKYSLSLEQYEGMKLGQGNACHVCKAQTKLSVDHCHKTGKVRALLCNPCNTALGMLKENPERIRALASYAEAHNV